MTYERPRIVKFQYPLENGAWGFPRLADRRVEPFVLMCVHITGNRNTAAMPVGVDAGSGTRAEVLYMARDRHFDSPRPDYGNSAHDYIGRNGDILACLPTKLCGWNNGGLFSPNVTLPGVRRVVRLTQQGRNANEAYVREVECTGYPGSHPLTKAQKESVAYLIARDSRRTGLPITRDTVHVHADLDSVNRSSCPFPAKTREQQIRTLIIRARQIKDLLGAGTEPDPGPEPPPAPDPCDDLRDQLAATLGAVEDLEDQVAGRDKAIAVAVGALSPFDAGDDE